MKSKSEMLVPRESEAEAAGVLAALDGMNEEQKRSCWCFWTALPLGSGWPRRAARRRKRKE